MSEKGKYLIFCIEQYRAEKGMNGREVIDLFDRFGIAEYIYECAGALHTTGTEYMINDIDQLIKERSSI